MRLLVTRPEPDAARTAAVLRARGHDALVAPLMRIEPVAAALAGDFAAILMTSANAARAIAERAPELRRLPVFVVGGRTAAAARDAGFADVTSADGALDDLVSLVVARFGRAGAHVLYLAGEDRAGDLAGALLEHGIVARTAVVYRAVAATALPDDIADAIRKGGLDGVLHYSRRSAATLLRLAEGAALLNGLLKVRHYCLSEEVAASLRNRNAAHVLVAGSPDEAALLDRVGRA